MLRGRAQQDSLGGAALPESSYDESGTAAPRFGFVLAAERLNVMPRETTSYRCVPRAGRCKHLHQHDRETAARDDEEDVA